MYLIAGVKPVQDDARAGHVVPPLGVAQLCGRVGAVYRADGTAVRTQPLHDLREQRVLLVGVALVVGLDAVRHRKVLKDAADVQPGQGVESLQLADGLRKAGTHRKADAAHAGVDLQVDLNLDARLDGGSGERLCVFGRIAGGDQAVGSQHSRIGGVGVAQNQDGCCDAAAAQVPPLAKGTDREARSTGFLQNAGDDVIAVAVGVRLDDGADRPAYGAADIFIIFTQGRQIDLGPAVLFQGKCIHSAPFPP